MSGITGIITTNPAPIDRGILQAMTDIISHRGPDGEAHFVAPHTALGYRHLDVYGLTPAQAQSIFHLGRYVVVFDGRIYNMPELQEELLSHGYKFDCQSDAELLATAYDKWGVDCLSKLNADWSFVLYDKENQNYFISRDRFGVKPLYYYVDEDKFIFGSEVKAIFENPDVRREPNELYLEQYLEGGSKEWAAPTAFKNILRFPFAHYFLGSKEQLLSARSFTSYWELSTNNAREKFCHHKAREYSNHYYELLSDAVQIRMRCKVRVGAALSGGLDSSSIVYLMNKRLLEQDSSAPLQTFSSIYTSPGTEHCDESQFINLVASQLGVNSNQIEPKVEEVPDEHSKMIWAIENPPDNTLMSSWHTFTAVRSCGFKVNLDGQGADEQLAGYYRFIPVYLMSLSIMEFYKYFFRFLSIHGFRKGIIMTFFMIHFKFLFGDKIYRKTFKFLRDSEAPKSLNDELNISLESILVNLLHCADHTSNAFSVECRMPFMDYRLIKFLAEVPACYKMHDGWTKYLARLAFDGKLPDDVCWRKDKMGWPIPEEYWFRNDLKKWVSGLNIDSSSDEGFAKFVRKINLQVFRKIWF